MKVNDEWIEFVNKNKDAVSNLIDVYNEECLQRFDFCKELNKKIKEIDPSINVGTYSGGRIDPYYSVYVNIKLENETMSCIETYIMKKPTIGKLYEDYSKVYMALWDRNHQGYGHLEKLVNTIGIKTAERHTSDGWKEQFILQIHPVDSIDINKLASDIVEYANIIKHSFGKKDQ